MESVTVSRHLEAPPAAVRAEISDVEAFMRGGGFDEVVVEGERIELSNRVGIATLELVLERFEDEESVLAYRQHEGIFDEMETRYTVTPRESGCDVVADTTFAIDVALVGELLDATVIERQRRRELNAQFDWLAARVRD